jgi:hypothetical protein
MVLGPLEYLVVGFEKYRFTGQILAELRAAQEQGIIRVVDLCGIQKDEQGNVTVRELSDLSGEEATELSPLATNVMTLLAEIPSIVSAQSQVKLNSSLSSVSSTPLQRAEICTAYPYQVRSSTEQ